MLKASEFCDAQNECIILLDSLQLMTDHISKLFGFINIQSEDDDGTINSLMPYSDEHFENLQKAAKQLSSYSDRFINKLNAFKLVLDKLNK